MKSCAKLVINGRKGIEAANTYQGITQAYVNKIATWNSSFFWYPIAEEYLCYCPELYKTACCEN